MDFAHQNWLILAGFMKAEQFCDVKQNETKAIDSGVLVGSRAQRKQVNSQLEVFFSKNTTWMSQEVSKWLVNGL